MKPLSEILGLVKREHSRHYGNVCDCGASGHNDALNDLDQRLPSVDELVKIIMVENKGTTDDNDRALAQAIINSMDKWIKKG